MSRTINTTINGPLFLLPTDNPLTITSSGSVISTTGTPQSPVDAIDGGAGTSWAITNSGIVSSSFGYGVSLAGAGSSVTNSGSISGTGPAGFNFISGVAITGASGTVTNAGTISVSGGGYGVHLAGGGAVTNSFIVTGGEDGVLIEGGPGQINNTGAISASVDDGAALFAGGTITNGTTGSIEGLVGAHAAGVFVQGGSGNLQNDGIVKGNNFGVFLLAGGSVTNGAGNASASISAEGVGVSGTSFGIFVTGNPATVTNYGTIDGGPAAGSEGAELDQGGNVTNNPGGTIRGTGFGVFIASNSGSSATVTNAGAISGTIASVEFAGTGANTLTLQTGSTLTGAAIGSTASGATNALVLEGKGNGEQQLRQLQHAGRAGERRLDARRRFDVRRDDGFVGQAGRRRRSEQRPRDARRCGRRPRAAHDRLDGKLGHPRRQRDRARQLPVVVHLQLRSVREDWRKRNKRHRAAAAH